MKRRVRRVFDVVLPLIGMGVIFGSVLFGSPSHLQLQVILLLFGVLILEAGGWGITGGVLPNERRYPLLRQETRHFLKMVRGLNAAAVARDEGSEDATRFEESLAEMRASVERLGKVAGQGTSVEVEELPAEETPRRRDSPRLPADARGPTSGPARPTTSADAAPWDQKAVPNRR